jgi:formate hydrogenlyase subunit 6/NADH:ubiquinone oxidoreductase subunit I
MSVQSYFSGIWKVGRSILIGMRITLKYFIHYKKNTCTIQYPHEHDVIPPRHRGVHYLETEKCVMCWKCSEICPVSCIYIEGVRGSDGVLKGGYRGQKATLSKFTIDYTVCIFCGLCEEPCPPKCIYLGPGYEFNSTDRTRMEKNLLTDEVYTEEDEKFVRWARDEAERLKAEKKRKADEEKARAAAAKMVAATVAQAGAAAKPAGPGAQKPTQEARPAAAPPAGSPPAGSPPPEAPPGAGTGGATS